MAAHLISIGKSGALAARAALDITAQNIANAANETYARRSVQMGEVAATGGIGINSGATMAGVRAERVLRTNSLFLQSEARRTGSDAARASAELSGMANAETAVEQSGIFSGIVEFEASLAQLASDPLDGSLRAAVVESARTLTQSFGIASQGLDVAAQELQFGATDSVGEVNRLAADLARTNIGLARAEDGSSNKAALLDQRDALLGQMAGLAGISSSFDPLGRVTVRLVDNAGPIMVDGAVSGTLTSTINAAGGLDFTSGGAGITLASGALAGQAQALDFIASLRLSLDSVANNLITTANAVQSGGITPSGAAGGAIFSGSSAADIAMILTDGTQLATAPAGAGAGSLDPGNLDVLRSALSATTGPAAEMDVLLYGLSNAVAGRRTTGAALETIAASARVALSAETGVDLDAEAANLIRYQQAFQASGRVIETATVLFDTLLAIR